jgi:predicted permease
MGNAAMVSPGFLHTLGIAIARGRDIDWNDDERHPHVAILSSSLAARLFPTGSALGQRIRFSFMPEFENLEVVGIANNARLFNLHDPAPPVIYLPYLQFLQSDRGGYLFVRTGSPPEALRKAVGNEIDSLGREYPLSMGKLGDQITLGLVEDHAIALLSGFFGALALLLALVGLYGLTSYGVARRTREVGIRAALGAQRATILWLVLHEVLGLGLVGVALGIPCALAASRLMASMLFGVSSHDLPTLAAVSLLLLVVALVAGYLPARRATKVDPMVALRYE